jgi:hypothetical protein
MVLCPAAVGPVPNHTISTTGLTCSNSLLVDSGGFVQNKTDLFTTDGKAILEVLKSTRLYLPDGSPLLNLIASALSGQADSASSVILWSSDFGPNGANFKPAITLTLKYDSLSVPRGVMKTTYTLPAGRLQWFNWKDSGCRAKTVSARTAISAGIALMAFRHRHRRISHSDVAVLSGCYSGFSR